jgi:hypothetical protein
MNRKETARRLYQLLAYQNAQTEKRWEAASKPEPRQYTPFVPRQYKPLDMTYLRRRRAGWAARRLGLAAELTDAEVRFLSCLPCCAGCGPVTRFHEVRDVGSASASACPAHRASPEAVAIR